ncbi:hypothetical protein [Paenibacillus sp. PK3_47]|uniref:hypothetical protein n=1 Tax=Paenibacillus sp. PK3_47 TaxID=2072642 RepID=UPI00201DF494|nr:hypothetical protein [Paenibacillus sp. PK3_47]
MSKLKEIPKLKSLRLNRVDALDSHTIGTLVNLTELSMEEVEAGDLGYIADLKKLKKLELKRVTIPDLAFLKNLKHLTTFSTDERARDESHLAVAGELRKLVEFTYPAGDLSIFRDSAALREIGVDAARYSGLEQISGCNLKGITIFGAASEEEAHAVVAEFKTYFSLQSYGWQVTWKE